VYHEKWGPTVLCVGLFVAVFVNFVLKVKDGTYADFPRDGGGGSIKHPWKGHS